MTAKHHLKQHYFLTHGYGSGTSELDIYRGFLVRFLCDKKKFKLTLSELRNQLRRDYGLTVPPFTIESLLKNLSKEHEGLRIENDSVILTKIHKTLEDEARKSVTDFDSDIRKIKGSFNRYLKENAQNKESSHSEIQSWVEEIHKIIVSGDKNVSALNTKQKLFFEWMIKILRGESPEELFRILNKLLYASASYYYWTQFRVPNKQLQDLCVTLDTNVLAYAIGLSGHSRQEFVFELFDLIKRNNLTPVVATPTLRELSELINRGTRPQVQVFRLDHPDFANQLINNTKTALRTRIEERLPPIRWQDSKIPADKEKNKEWAGLYSDLANFKKDRRKEKEYSEFSFDHDINLVVGSNALSSHSNIYDQKEVVVTSDYLFSNWFQDYCSKHLHKRFSPVITVDQFAYFLWLEGDKTSDDRFMANAWLYIIDSVPFFKEERMNNFFRILTDIPAERQTVPNWRSTYLLVVNKLGTDDPRTLSKMDETEMLQKIRGVGEELSVATHRISELERENQKTKKELREMQASEQQKKSANLLSEFLLTLFNIVRRFFGS
tara:strand:- start:58 stop:1710 length:1653 start_codon:yes stop_codon:yes gene_type:complete